MSLGRDEIRHIPFGISGPGIAAAIPTQARLVWVRAGASLSLTLIQVLKTFWHRGLRSLMVLGVVASWCSG